VVRATEDDVVECFNSTSNVCAVTPPAGCVNQETPHASWGGRPPDNRGIGLFGSNRGVRTGPPIASLRYGRVPHHGDPH
jgi:hypothetical protein